MVKWFRRKGGEDQTGRAAVDRTENQLPHQPREESAEPLAENSLEATKDASSGFFSNLRQSLRKTRQSLGGQIDRLLLGKKEIDEDVLEQLEEVLITSDIGVDTTSKLITALEERLHRRELTDADRLRIHLKDEIRRLLKLDAPAQEILAHKPFVIMAIGVNGVGKTTTLAKLAYRYQEAGLRTMLVAADTFRAAAVEQLAEWAERIGADLVKQRSGADPAAVVYDAMDAAQARGVDVVLIDTAGRLHTRVNLMEELKKVKRVIAGQMPGAPHEVLLVLDATTGQNALSQVRLFHHELGVSGLALTKLDGTAKGGIVVGICQEFKIPIRFIGLGEGLSDLRDFNSEDFVAALL